MSLNPFYWKGPITSPEDMVERGQFAREVALQIKSGANLSLFGPRKKGKSTFAFRLADELHRAHGEDAPPVVAVYVELQRAVSLRALISCVRDAVRDPRLPQRGRREVERALETIEREKGFSYKGLGYTRKINTSEALQADESVLFDTLVALRKLGDRVVVIFDEFQRLGTLVKRGDDDVNPLYTIRAALMSGGRGGDVSLFVTGSIRQALEDLLVDDNSPFFEQFQQIELPPLSRSSFLDFLELRFAATGKPSEETALEYLLTLTEDHPLRTQQLASRVWDAAAEGELVGADLVERVYGEMMSGFEPDFSSRESELLNGKPGDVQAQRLLYLLADHGWAGASSEGRLQAYGLNNPNTLYSARDDLIRKGLVEPVPGQGRAVQIVDPLFAAWLSRVSPLRLEASSEPKALESRPRLALSSGETPASDHDKEVSSSDG